MTVPEPEVTRPLEGVRIVSFTQFLLGPAAVQYLADLGADVVKVEPPAGAWERSWAGGESFLNGVSVFFMLAHRNARSVTLDLKSREGLEAARKLIETADVLVENFRPGVMDSLGLGYDAVHEQHPRLIYASASGYGSTGPFRKLPGQDLLLQAITGLAANTGSAQEAPVPVGAAVIDQHGAALLAMGVLAALLHRERTGKGQHVELNMIQAGLDLQTEPLTYHLNGGQVSVPQERLGSPFHPAPYGIYKTRDGNVAISLSPVATVRQALDGAPELEPFEDPSLALNARDEIRRALAPLLASYTTSEIVEKLRKGGVWCNAVNDFTAALKDPVVTEVDPIMQIEHPDAGTIRLLRHPVNYSSIDTSVRRTPPRLGEHTEEILSEFGNARPGPENTETPLG
ncbi:CaiB/BaiF CoA transferase family protein [Arthrobacter sp. GCM10027362]|uniref:CaiB/BaiF CoA transferase family protein n=1 Tax=Arthrobacter sp. GCM10027362 TaxID=3273379 RepID=UPI00362EB644